MTPFAPPRPALTDRSAQIEAPASRRSTIGDSGEAPTVYKITLSSQPSAWFDATLKRISRLTSLARGWNSYGAHEVKADMALEAVQFLTKVAYPGIAAPSIVPLADGGLQVEWHRGGLDIEIAFSDDDPGVFVMDRGNGEPEELPLADAVAVIGRFTPRLMSS